MTLQSFLMYNHSQPQSNTIHYQALMKNVYAPLLHVDTSFPKFNLLFI